jgi:hypothetical protein
LYIAKGNKGTFKSQKSGINSIFNAYEDTFIDDVWERRYGSCLAHSLWKIPQRTSTRENAWLKKDIENEVRALRWLKEEHDELGRRVGR